MIYLELVGTQTLYVLITEIAAWYEDYPDTVVVLKSGEKLTVTNAPEVIHERILEYYELGYKEDKERG